MSEERKENPLKAAPVSKLMFRFAIPSIIAMLVGALYNIVDQLFIGQKVGMLGNGATNVAFPLTTSCLAIGLLFGIGGASCFNLSLGRGEKEKAPYYMANALFMLVLCGVLLSLVSEVFLEPLLRFFGAPEDTLSYAMEYVRITAIGYPFMLLTVGGGHLIRADGSPRMTMLCNLTGAVINTVLDAIFVLGMDWGMSGAALATVIGQVISAIMAICYLRHCKSVKLQKKHFIPRLSCIGTIASIGMASFFNQLAMMLVQIVLNRSLKYYGAMSVYGESIPIAAAGIVMKVSQVFFSIVIGLGQGSQPIESFNYGAKNYERVRKAYWMAIFAGAVVSLASFAAFQFFPRQIISLFGESSEGNSELYFEFGVKYFRIFMFFMCLNFIQPITSTFFTSIGKAIKGVFLSMTRQILFLLPLIVVLPRFYGMDGILFAGPIADFAAAIVTTGFVLVEFKKMRREEKNA